jgi:hypothetical protein
LRPSTLAWKLLVWEPRHEGAKSVKRVDPLVGVGSARSLRHVRDRMGDGGGQLDAHVGRGRRSVRLVARGARMDWVGLVRQKVRRHGVVACRRRFVVGVGILAGALTSAQAWPQAIGWGCSGLMVCLWAWARARVEAEAGVGVADAP